MIVSTGAQSLLLGLEAEQRLIGHGLSTCATCDGFFFRGQHIAVVGGGDSAIEEATFLTRFADKVTLIHRRDSLRASKIMQDRAFANPKIEFLWDSVVTDILGDERVEGVRVRNVKTDEDSTLPVSGLFVAIGHRPNTDLFADVLERRRPGLPAHPRRVDGDEHRRRVRLRRRAGSRLSPGDHRRRIRLHGGDRRRALARGATPLTGHRDDRSPPTFWGSAVSDVATDLPE